tara:strand:- start:244 stop:507 length:264 start_codon:yes stop_codon:yes gene_type:complete
MKLAELYNSKYKKAPISQPKPISKPKSSEVKVVVRMPEVSDLIRHLDILYSSMIVQNMSRASSGNMWETVSWFNPGQGAVKQSQSVN